MFQILYEDESVLVAHKPAGLAVQTARASQKDMVSILKNYFVTKGHSSYVGIVHRLDQPVEGVILFAKTKEAAANFTGQVMKQQLGKKYRAVVWLSREDIDKKGRLEDFLKKDAKTNTSYVVSSEEPGAKKAILDYEVIRCQGHLAEVDIELRTGRHHQIRVQMSHAGMPLVGDLKYGIGKANELEGADRNVALCAAALDWIHPVTGEKMHSRIEPENKSFQLLA